MGAESFLPLDLDLPYYGAKMTEAIRVAYGQLCEVLSEYNWLWPVLLDWGFVYLLAAIVVAFVYVMIHRYRKRCLPPSRHSRDLSCRTEKERTLSDSIWKANIEIDCLTSDLTTAKGKIMDLEGQVEQLLAVLFDQESETSTRMKFLNERAAHLEKERALLLSVAQQQEHLLELLQEAHKQGLMTKQQTNVTQEESERPQTS